MSLQTALKNPETLRLLLTGFTSFILIGATQAMYGPAFPAFQERYGLSTATVGLLVSFHFIGSFISILTSGLTVKRFGYKAMLSSASLLLMLGSTGLALSPNWYLTLSSSFLTGLGFGFFDAGMNMIFSRTFEPNSAPPLNVLNALFGVGAVLGPLLIALFLPVTSYPFLIISGFSLLILLFCRSLPNPDPVTQEAKKVRIPWVQFAGFILIYLLYVASEVGAASWEATHLGPYYGESKAALFTSLYWAALTLGRFVAAPISAFLRPGTLIVLSVSLALVAALFAHNVTLAPYAYAVIGFAFAPIFPTGLAWLQTVFPNRAEQLIPIIMAAANIGAVLSSPLIGWIIGMSSSNAVPTIMSVTAALLLVITLFMWFTNRK